MKPSRLIVEDLPISTIHINPRNARTHSNKQIRQIADSMEEFGFTNPLLIDESSGLIAGHGRLLAATRLGLETVPVIRITGLTKAQRRALALADNKLAENAGWNVEMLAGELEYLCEVAVDFDVSITGFESAEIDLVIERAAPASDDSGADEIPEFVHDDEVVVRDGELWLLGHHRLLCGNAMMASSFERLMTGAEAQMVVIDPPYNLPIDGHVSGHGAVHHRNFAMASGEMSEEEFTAFLETAFRHLANHSAEGSIHFVFMDWRHLGEVLGAGRRCYRELKNLCVWNKSNAGMGSLYRSQHELVLVFLNGTGRHINNVELGRYGRNRSNVWNYPGANTFREGRLDDLRMHPTVKPVALVADAILDCSKRGGIVLDCFAGSGTTLVAAEKTGRRAYAMEIDPTYVEVAIRRWQNYTDKAAVNAACGKTFAEIAASRSRNQPTSKSPDPGLTDEKVVRDVG
jgi:DNA modification methylase